MFSIRFYHATGEMILRMKMLLRIAAQTFNLNYTLYASLLGDEKLNGNLEF